LDITPFLKDKEVREALEKIVKYEEEKEKEYSTNEVYRGLDLKPYWSWQNVGVHWSLIHKLVTADIVRAFGGRRKEYLLKNRTEIKRILDEVKLQEKMELESQKIEGEEVEEIPNDLFNVIVGYKDVKKLFLMSLKAEKPTHILMTGPPASSKSVILLEIARLKGAFYLLGGSTTKVGFIDQLFNLRPNYILLDEADKMNREDFTALLSLMETGIVKEVKHNKTRELTLPAKVYAACNVKENLPPELLSRFQFKLHFKPYTREEFIEVSKRVLTLREGKDEELALYIANKVSLLSRDVRDCIGIARLSETKNDVDFLIEVKKKYASM